MTPLVEKWYLGFAESARGSYLSALRGFEAWLKDRGEFGSLEEAVRFQKGAAGDDRYRLSDLVAEYVREHGGTYKSLEWYYAVIRSFFLFCRAELPKVRVSFEPTKDATVSRLDLDVFKVLLKDSGLRDQAIYLTLFQGIIDQHRFFTSFNPRGFELGEHIKKSGVEVPFRVDFLRGRKRNYRAYNTWVGREALEAWRLYFERKRGYPKKGKCAALDQYGKPLTKEGFYRAHTRKLRKLGYVDGFGDVSSRYGYNPHELRDLARSVLEKAKGEGFNTLSAEYWMGHKVDPLFYNKIWKLDPAYNLEQYRIAEKHLNIVSGMQTDRSHEQEIQRLKKDWEEKEQAILEVLQRLTTVEQYVAKLKEAKGSPLASAAQAQAHP